MNGEGFILLPGCYGLLISQYGRFLIGYGCQLKSSEIPVKTALFYMNCDRCIRLFFVIFLSVYATVQGNAQVVFEHIDNRTIYEFLDEMANIKLIDINSGVKPYSRRFIMHQLDSLATKTDKLNKRQLEELKFYLKDYVRDRIGDETLPASSAYPEGGYPTKSLDYIGKGLKRGDVFPFKKRAKKYDLFAYRDTKFSVAVNPVFGGEGWVNENGVNYHNYYGGELFGYVWKLGFYGNVRENFEFKGLSNPEFLTKRRGAFAKISGDNSREFSEARGGLTISHAGVTLGIIKDHIQWGNNYNGSNIHGQRNPSFPMLFFQIKPVKWFELNYYHGWLTSDVVDSARTTIYSSGPFRQLVPKYVAANLYTFRPFKSFYLSVGNSVVYEGDMNPAYLIPFLFYKSVDHGSEQNTNAQFFVDISSRNIRKNHLSFTMYLDEITFRYITDPDRHSNWWSFKGSWRYSNFVPNLSFTAEYTYTAPMVYKHFIPTTTYETSSYNLGHYLRDNSQEIFVMFDWKPIARLRAKLHYIYASRGNDYVDDRVTINPNTGLVVVHGLPFQESVLWSNHEVGVGLQYELVNGVHLALNYWYADLEDVTGNYTAEYFQNSAHNASLKVNVGF